MTTLELLEQHPKTTTLVKDWFLYKMLESIKDSHDVPDDFKEMMKAQPFENANIAAMIDASPRLLFDFFDAQEFFIQINVNTPYFSYSINEGDIISGSWVKRIEADKAAIIVSFEMLEKQL